MTALVNVMGVGLPGGKIQARVAGCCYDYDHFMINYDETNLRN